MTNILLSVLLALISPISNNAEIAIQNASQSEQQQIDITTLAKHLPLSPATDFVTLEEQIKKNPVQWKAAVDFLMKSDLMKLSAGRHEITTDGVFANVQEYETKDEARYECHRKYIDIQCVVSGTEHIYVANIGKVSDPVAEFNDKKDIQFFTTASEHTKVLAGKDSYVVLFPHEAHKPCMNVDGQHSHIRKIVVKIPFIQ